MPAYDLSHYKRAYNDHKFGAKKRGIAFLLTFSEWFSIWESSGHIDDRGRSLHQYQMARFGDSGPYAVGNVRIITCLDNKLEFSFTEQQIQKIIDKATGGKGRKLSKETRAKMSASHTGKRMSAVQYEAYIKSQTPEVRKKRALAISKALKGKPKSKEHRRNLSKPKSEEHKYKLSLARSLLTENQISEIAKKYVPYTRGLIRSLSEEYNVLPHVIYDALQRRKRS